MNTQFIRYVNRNSTLGAFRADASPRLEFILDLFEALPRRIGLNPAISVFVRLIETVE